MKILIIEDHPYKLGQILNLLKENFPKVDVVTRGSYNSGLRELITNYESYQLVLLDISMPNYDINIGESGGDFIPLAGKLILNEMYLREIPTKVIVVTMYENFVDGTPLMMLDESFKDEYSDNYLGYVYFTATNNIWKDELTNLIKKQTI